MSDISCDSFLCAASTRKLYERKLQKVLDEPSSDSTTVTEAVPEIAILADTNQNGNTHTDQYSDKEDGKILIVYIATFRVSHSTLQLRRLPKQHRPAALTASKKTKQAPYTSQTCEPLEVHVSNPPP